MELKNSRCVIVDAEEAGLTPEGALTEDAGKAVREAAGLSIPVILTAEPAFCSLPEGLRKADGISYIVSSDGAAIHNAKTGEKIHERLMGGNDVRALLNRLGHFFVEGQIVYEAVAGDVCHATEMFAQDPAAFGVPADMVEQIRKTRIPEKYMIDFIFKYADELESIEILIKDSMLDTIVENQIKMVHAELRSMHPKLTKYNQLKILHRDADKSSAVQFILEELGIGAEETFRFSRQS